MEGGHEGGRLKVEYEEKEELFENHKNSHQNYFLSAYYNCCHHTMEPVTRGFKLTLVYSLVWKNAKMTGIPHDIPVFLTVLKEVKIALAPWIPPKEDFNNSPEESKEKWRQVQPLFFVLKEKYQDRDLSFHRLQGSDRKLSQILRCSLFLEMHLAMVKTTVTTEMHTANNCYDYNYGQVSETQSTKISRWIDSNDAEISLDLEFDWEKQCVGSIGNLLKTNGTRPDEKSIFCNRGCITPIHQKHYHHSILVIWPKRESLKMYCRHGLDSFLDRMEISLNGQHDVREKAVQDLRQVISFCCDQPIQVWMKPGTMKGELTLKLLRLCTSLGARQEGLAVLKFLGSDFGPIRVGSETFEGIQNGKVARAIAEFECNVAGKSLFLFE